MYRILLHASFACFLIPFLSILSVLEPEFQHYYIPTPELDESVIDAFRSFPTAVTYRALGQMQDNEDDTEIVHQAEQILAGRFTITGNSDDSFANAEFETAQFTSGSVERQLSYARLIIPKVLLMAYQVTRHDEFFMAARRFILAFANYERRAWLPEGFLWNDDAIAARIPVLTQFWWEFRSRPDFDRADAATVLQLIFRSGALLAKPDHFTFATNHGVMQNLGLLYIVAAFPTLDPNRQWSNLAVNRLGMQLNFYINDEGIVLEHSIGYHVFGVQLLGTILRYLSLLDIPIPSAWSDKYRHAINWYEQLRRPDGTLPIFGDTVQKADPFGLEVVKLNQDNRVVGVSRDTAWRPKQVQSLRPVAGYAVWWSGLEQWPGPQGITQTVIAWSNIEGHGHKHDDEMSLSIWADGWSWLTNTGYWPYRAGREKAISWQGSNAPHLAEEPPGGEFAGKRNTRLVWYGWQQNLALWDLQRQVDTGQTLRRQILQLDNHIWVVLDQITGAKAQVLETVWTSNPTLRLTRGDASEHYFVLSPNLTTDPTMDVTFLGSGNIILQENKGSLEPFAGWVVVDNHWPIPAPAIVLRQNTPDRGWAVSVWYLRKQGDNTPFVPKMLRWDNPEQWELALNSEDWKLQRQEEQVWVIKADKPKESMTLTLNAGPDVSAERAKLAAAYKAAHDRFGRFRELWPWRIRIAKLLGSVLILQEVVFLLYRRRTRHFYLALRLFSAVVWAGIGCWLSFVYFSV